jgi:hypothetical protein
VLLTHKNRLLPPAFREGGGAIHNPRSIMIVLLAGGGTTRPPEDGPIASALAVGYGHGSARSARRRRQRRALYRCRFAWLQRCMGLAVRLTDAHPDP